MPVEDKSMIHRLLMSSAFAFACLVVPSKAENIVCPPENDIAATFDKWTPDYAGSLNEVFLSRHFLKDQEGAMIRCKRTIGSVQIMFRKKSCRIVAGAGSAEISPHPSSEDTVCSLTRLFPVTNDKACIVECR
jgi:hypothetical protein